MIFQTEKQLKEYGDKLSAGNKTAIEDALGKLRTAHGAKDIAGIDAALEGLTNAWSAASQEMYAATKDWIEERHIFPPEKAGDGDYAQAVAFAAE